MYLSFPADDVDATYAELVARGARSLTVPQDNLMQQARLAHISDPSGHIIEIAGPMRGTGTPKA
jgi:predicted enzyme related to lactoylglutathione lyase